MTVYLDLDYKCHVANEGNLLAYETDFFDGKCKAYIEGFRCVPAGHEWTREDGKVFKPQGDMISPCRDLALLEEFQAQYEVQQKTINEYEAALSEIETALGVISE